MNNKRRIQERNKNIPVPKWKYNTTNFWNTLLDLRGKFVTLSS